MDTGPADLLVRCLSGRNGTALSGLVGQTSTGDWNRAVEFADREHVAPLVFKRLKQIDAQVGVPPAAWNRLRRAYFTSGDRNTRLYRELRAALECLRGAGIRVMVLKGPFLGEAIYGDVALRPMCDADLMVERADLARASAVLLELGHPERPGPAAPSPVEPDGAEAKHVRPIVIQDLAIELHWTIVAPDGPVKLEVAGLWDRARPTTTAGVEVLALSREDLLLHLCLHFCYQHGCVGLRHLCDVAETVHRLGSELDWVRVSGMAREWNAARYVALALHLARSVLTAEVPDDVLERLVRGGLDPGLIEQARECVLERESYDNWSLLPFPNRFGGSSTLERMKTLRDVIFLSRDEMALRYPMSRDSRLLWPYYVRRLVDLPREYGRATLRQGLRLMRVRERDSTQSLAKWLKSGKA